MKTLLSSVAAVVASAFIVSQQSVVAQDVTGPRGNIGTNHTLTGSYSSILGGKNNTVTNFQSVVGGGTNNYIGAYEAVIGGGRDNYIEKAKHTVIAGRRQRLSECNWRRGSKHHRDQRPAIFWVVGNCGRLL